MSVAGYMFEGYSELKMADWTAESVPEQVDVRNRKDSLILGRIGLQCRSDPCPLLGGNAYITIRECHVCF